MEEWRGGRGKYTCRTVGVYDRLEGLLGIRSPQHAVSHCKSQSAHDRHIANVWQLAWWVTSPARQPYLAVSPVIGALQ